MSNTAPSPLLPLVARTFAGTCPATPASVLAGIPATFTEDQARLVLMLKGIPPDSVEVENLLWAPGRFTDAQRTCATALLQLGPRDFCETLADAMEPCALRGTLMRWHRGTAAAWPS